MTKDKASHHFQHFPFLFFFLFSAPTFSTKWSNPK